ncbi:MAG: class I SAM-dependent methyltransferase [Flavobacterium sp.]|nr:MAG: class I SAM-dependent methyltransferase [Flavobacterium sp.]
MDDIFGEALLDYHAGEQMGELITETSISEEDVLPVSYLFRSYKSMPSLEQKALAHCRGDILDVGCGAGSHSLYLQDQGLNVTAIDESQGAVHVARSRGVEYVIHSSLLNFSEGGFDTILLLMNGTGIFSTLKEVPRYLEHLKKLLDPGGQILIDGSDLQYMYDRSAEGGIMVPANRYYGELDFVITYKSRSSRPFPWLYLDERLFELLADDHGFNFEILERGENFDYLAKLSVR